MTDTSNTQQEPNMTSQTTTDTYGVTYITEIFAAGNGLGERVLRFAAATQAEAGAALAEARRLVRTGAVVRADRAYGREAGWLFDCGRRGAQAEFAADAEILKYAPTRRS